MNSSTDMSIFYRHNQRSNVSSRKRRHTQGSADRPYNNEIVIISPNEAKSLSKGLLNLGNITKVVSNRGKAKM